MTARENSVPEPDPASHPGSHPDVLAVADRLHSAAIHLLRRVRKQDVATGEGPARLSALSVLVFGGPKTLGELAAAEQVKPPTMSRIVAGLARSRLVTITADPARRPPHAHSRDRQKGAACSRRAASCASPTSPHISTGLAPEELAKLGEAVEILQKLLEAWSDFHLAVMPTGYYGQVKRARLYRILVGSRGLESVPPRGWCRPALWAVPVILPCDIICKIPF